MSNDCAAPQLESGPRDVSLRHILPAGTDLYHVTKAIGDIEATGEILPLAELKRRNSNATSGFGQGGGLRADEYVSLTISQDRGQSYFDILVALAAIAEDKATPAQWLPWYLGRWGDTVELLNAVATDFESELPEALALRLEKLKITTVRRPATEILREALSALNTSSIVARLAWLFETDRDLMQVDPDNADCGLSVVHPDVEAWAKVRICDVALLKARLSDDAIGYKHREEEEVRVRGAVESFEVVSRGEERFAAWTWDQ